MLRRSSAWFACRPRIWNRPQLADAGCSASRALQAAVFGQSTGVRVLEQDVLVAPGGLLGVDAGGLQLGPEHVAFEQDLRLHAHEAGAARFDAVDGAHQRHFQVAGGGEVVDVLLRQPFRGHLGQQGRLLREQRGPGLLAGHAVGNESVAQLEVADRLRGGGAEHAVGVDVGAAGAQEHLQRDRLALRRDATGDRVHQSSSVSNGSRRRLLSRAAS